MLEKPLNEFYKHKSMVQGVFSKCKECTKTDVRDNLKRNKHYYNLYDRNRSRYDIKRIFLLRYTKMKSRVSGKSRKYLVTGTDMLSKEDFINWCFGDSFKEFNKIYNKWVSSGFDLRESPSIDRINSNEGYTLNNIQWLPQYKNCKKNTPTQFK